MALQKLLSGASYYLFSPSPGWAYDKADRCGGMLNQDYRYRSRAAEPTVSISASDSTRPTISLHGWHPAMALSRLLVAL